MEELAMKKETAVRCGLIVVLIVSLLGCANGEGIQGVTEDTIRVGMIMDLTGPLAFLGQEVSTGAELYIRHVNEQGGVHGRTIELIVEDDGYQPARTVAAYRKLVDLDGVFCLLGDTGSATTMALMPMLEREQVPLVFPGTFSSVAYTPPRRYVFVPPPSYRIQSWAMVQYIQEISKVDNARLGIVYQDDDFGLDGLSGLRDAADYYGLPIVAEESYKRGTVDFSTQVLNLKKLDPTHVILFTVLRETAAVLKEADKLGWEPQFLVNNTVADDQIVKMAGKTAKNTLIVNVLDSESEKEQVKRYLALIDKYTPDRGPRTYHAFGYAGAQALVEALRRAGNQPTREKLVDSLETFDAWDDNVFSTPITYGPGLRGGTSSRWFFARPDWEQGRLVRATEDILFEMPQL